MSCSSYSAESFWSRILLTEVGLQIMRSSLMWFSFLKMGACRPLREDAPLKCGACFAQAQSPCACPHWGCELALGNYNHSVRMGWKPAGWLFRAGLNRSSRSAGGQQPLWYEPGGGHPSLFPSLVPLPGCNQQHSCCTTASGWKSSRPPAESRLKCTSRTECIKILYGQVE